jgi:hypothetical protein
MFIPIWILVTGSILIILAFMAMKGLNTIKLDSKQEDIASLQRDLSAARMMMLTTDKRRVNDDEDDWEMPADSCANLRR